MLNITNLPGTYDRVTTCVLVELERRVSTGTGTYTSTFFRFCNTMGTVTYNGAAGDDRPAVGAVFTRRSFTLSNAVQDTGIGVVSQIQFDDHDGTIKSTVLLYDMLDWVVRIWQVGLDENYGIDWIKLKQTGRTGDIDWDVNEGDTVAIDVGPYRDLGEISGPKESYSPSCRYKTRFKTDPRCAAVTAATTCDGQPATCRSYDNFQRFGGFPDAAKAGDKVTIGGGQIVLGSRNSTWSSGY